MRSIREFLSENKKKDERKPVFKETDPNVAFPNDTIAALKKEINKLAKDLEQDWPNALKLIEQVFQNLDVPKPSITQTERWDQYNELISYAVRQLYDARGPAGSWRVKSF